MTTAAVRTHLRPAEVASRLGVSKTTVNRWVTGGDLIHFRPSPGVVLIDPEDLAQFLDRHREGNELRRRR